jgi:hypothetical protein
VQQDRDHPITLMASPEQLLFEALQAMGSDGSGGTRRVVGAVAVYTNFAAIRRGPAEIDGDFDIRTLITPKARPSPKLRLRRAGRLLPSPVRRVIRRR